MSRRPSSLPAIATCPSFQSDKGRDFTLDGTIRHEALQSKFDSENAVIDPKLTPWLDDQSIEGIEWAYDYITRRIDGLKSQLYIEHKVESEALSNLGVADGTLDYHWQDHLFDFKWRERDYSLQMAAYAIALMEFLFVDRVTVHILYGETMNAVEYEITMEEAVSMIKEVVDDIHINPVKYRWSSYCGWCARKLDCPLIGAAIEESRRHPDFNLQSFDVSQLRQNEEEMNKAVKTARVLKKWIEEVEKQSREMAIGGLEFPDFELRSRAGNSNIEDVSRAYEDSGLPVDTFQECCSVSVTKLAEAWRAIHGTSVAASRSELKRRLGDNLKPGPKIYYLQKKREK